MLAVKFLEICVLYFTPDANDNGEHYAEGTLSGSTVKVTMIEACANSSFSRQHEQIMMQS